MRSGRIGEGSPSCDSQSRDAGGISKILFFFFCLFFVFVFRIFELIDD